MLMRAISAAVAWMMTPRSPQWPHIRRLHLQAEPRCQWCGTTEAVEVHHVEAVHARPDLELVFGNLITLCMSASRCHYVRGHRGVSWMAYDPDIRAKCEERKRKT